MKPTKKKRPKVEKKDGVTVAPVEHPRYNWRVTYTVGGRRKQLYFKKKTGEGGADEEAENKREELRKDGKREAEITPAERRAILAFREMVATLPDSINKPTLAEAVDLIGKHLAIRSKSKTVAELVDSLLKKLRRAGAGEAHLYTIQGRLDRFSGDYGDWLACDVSSEVIEDWLEDLNLADLTTNHYRSALGQLFGHAVDKKAAETNPITTVAKKNACDTEVGILKPAQVKTLLGKAPSEILPGLALGFFAGVRRAELCRMDWSEIDFEQNLIEVKASKSKTASRRLIPIRPNLRKWLLGCRKESGAIMPSEMVWRSRLADAMKAAKIEEWPHNAPRHSFASHHLARFKDAPALALEMGHGDTKMIFAHYRALVTPKAGAAFWRIAPPTPKKRPQKRTRSNVIDLAERRAG